MEYYTVIKNRVSVAYEGRGRGADSGVGRQGALKSRKENNAVANWSI